MNAKPPIPPENPFEVAHYDTQIVMNPDPWFERWLDRNEKDRLERERAKMLKALQKAFPDIDKMPKYHYNIYTRLFEWFCARN